MGLIKFIKNIFSKKEKEPIKVEENNSVENVIESERIISNTNSLNNTNNQDKYLENDRILKLKYLNQKNNIVEDNVQTAEVENITINDLKNIWDILKIKENTQAEHIIRSIPSDKWVTMDEIKHNIKLNFNIEYSNEKSLYPYLKTLTDINLIKLNNIGKKRSWKKNIILLK